ncbi:MAG TPA: ATP-binding protein [Miltoncostaeaceae bacterium]|nr:ATP-binding protein [Miltoncostaeaceae bacterium]
MTRRRPGLQGILIATLIAVGFAASLAVLVSVLPTLDQAVRRDRAQSEAVQLEGAIQRRLQREAPVDGPSLARFVQGVADEFGAEVRADLRGFPALRVQSRDCCDLIDAFGGRSYSRDALRDYSAVSVRVAAITPSGRVEIVAAAPVRGAAAAIGAVRDRLTIAVAVVFGLAAVAGYALSRLIGRRISRLARTATRLASGDLAARAPVAGPAELAMLGDGLNTMAARIETQVGQITGERDRARVLVASLAEGVIAVGDDGRVGQMNPAALRILGLPPGARLTRLDELPASLVRAVREAGDGGDWGSAEAALPDGSELQVTVTRLAPPDAGMVVTLRDVTEERRLDRARRDLVANVSHELKTPLAAIKGLLELLQGGRVDDRHRAEFLGLMSGEADRLERLVEEQLQLARLDAGGLPLERERFDLDALVEGVVASRRPLAEREGIVMSGGADGPVPVHADPARIEQILLILVDNALRHTAAGGEVEITAVRAGDRALLSVRDTGEGIPLEEQAFVFDRFYRGDRSREGRSAGLGLAIARALAHAHGGQIDLVSAPGAGSTFTLRLPLPAPPTAEHPVPGAAADRPA